MDDILFEESPKAKESELFRLGTVSAKYTSGTTGLTVRFDGESTASSKRFKCNTSISFASGNRVLCCKVGGTWVVLCVVGTPT